MKQPLISVIIPVYNAEKTIGHILDKLIIQPYKNIEVIAVNDGSKDSSAIILDGYVKKDKRIIVLHQHNGGASSARNAAIKVAKGEYITFIDSDDDFEDSMIPQLVSGVGRDFDFVVCGMKLNDKEIVAPNAKVSDDKIVTYILKSLLTKNLLYGPCCKLFKRSIIEDYAIRFPKNIHYGEDTIFVLDFLSHVKNLRMIDRPLYLYKMTKNGLSSNFASHAGYRKARLRALKNFTNKFSRFSHWSLYVLLRARWTAAYVKSSYRGMR